jgi:hypothetical protein
MNTSVLKKVAELFSLPLLMVEIAWNSDEVMEQKPWQVGSTMKDDPG